MRILIVDGSREQRLRLVHVLGAVTNIVVQGAVADMHSALHVIAEAQPDVIVTSSALPDAEATELIEGVRRLAQAPSFVVLADAENDAERARYLAIGADRYIARDIDSRALQGAVTTLRKRTAGSVPPAEAQRLLGRITAGVVHDLSNYLHVLDVSMMLLERHPGDAQLWKQSRIALQAMARLNAMLLSHARGSDVSAILVDLGAVARETVAVLGRIVPPNVTVSFDIAEKLPLAKGVRAELEQLLLNLIVNACDAMTDHGGVLTISIRPSMVGVIVLDVSDTGAGMNPGTNGSSTKRPGLGLGLGIVQAVVERHRGALSITSRETGGTKVVVMLPTTHD